MRYQRGSKLLGDLTDSIVHAFITPKHRTNHAGKLLFGCGGIICLDVRFSNER